MCKKNSVSPFTLFHNRNGKTEDGFTNIDSEVFETSNGILYLKSPGVVLISKPAVRITGIEKFLNGFKHRPDFKEYLLDKIKNSPAAILSKFAGQLCYMSLGRGRSLNQEIRKYLDRIKEQKHGSVFEHSNFTFLIYGISRSLTHELVRHRAGFGFSQVSQRYVDSKHSKTLRFVERPEYQSDEELHNLFVARIERAVKEYEEAAERLLDKQHDGWKLLAGEKKTDLRKKVNQCARSLLPNETEAPIVVTANIRAWRYFIEQRANDHAEIEIRELAIRVFLCLATIERELFSDYTIIELSDGTLGVDTPYKNV